MKKPCFSMSIGKQKIHSPFSLVPKHSAIYKLGSETGTGGSAVRAFFRCSICNFHCSGWIFQPSDIENGIWLIVVFHRIMTEIGVDQIMSHESIGAVFVPRHIFLRRTAENIMRTGGRVIVIHFPVETVFQRLACFQCVEAVLPAALPPQLSDPPLSRPFALGKNPWLLSV